MLCNLLLIILMFSSFTVMVASYRTPFHGSVHAVKGIRCMEYHVQSISHPSMNALILNTTTKSTGDEP